MPDKLPPGVESLKGFAVCGSGGGRRRELFCQPGREYDQWARALGMTGSKITDRYDLDWLNPIGAGGFATVLRGRCKATALPCAVKVLKLTDFDDEEMRLVDNELSILRQLGEHPNIAGLIEVLRTKSRIYVVLEMCSGGELVDYVSDSQSFSEFEAARCIKQVCKAIKHMHDRGFIHRDLKPENLIYKSKAVDAPLKLIDMGMAVYKGQRAEPAGTPEFLPPEVLADDMDDSQWDPSVDMWAVGILTYFLLSGLTPFQDTSVDRILFNVIEGRWSFDPAYFSEVSESAKGFIMHCLELDPSGRPTVDEALEHPWVKGETATTKSLLAAPRAFRSKLVLAKFRAAVTKIMVTNRFKVMFSPKTRASRAASKSSAALSRSGSRAARTMSMGRSRSGTAVSTVAGPLDAADLKRFRIRRRFRRAILASVACTRMYLAIKANRPPGSSPGSSSARGPPSPTAAGQIFSAGVRWLTGTESSA